MACVIGSRNYDSVATEVKLSSKIFQMHGARAGQIQPTMPFERKMP
jgi:hypothetical protein